MDINTPDEFIEKPVIDIDVTFGLAQPMRWTINDTPDAQFKNAPQGIQFFIVETQELVRIERAQIAWSAIRRRIDRIPVKKPVAVPQPQAA